MIPKRIDIEPENDNFDALADYIAAARDEGEKLEDLWVENCDAGDGIDDLDLVKKEVKATQALNQRTKSGKSYHLMISFRDEHPPLDVLKDIEAEFAKALGYAEHQRVIGTHVNTQNFHMHIAINKIHPVTLKAHTPLRDFKTLETVSRAMEQKHGLKVDLGRADKLQPDRRPRRAVDKEAHTWEQSFDGYVRDNKAELMTALQDAKSWQDLHASMARFTVELRPQGNGLVIADKAGKHRIKASSLDRQFSMKALESRLGQYQAPAADRTVDRDSEPPADRQSDRQQPGTDIATVSTAGKAGQFGKDALAKILQDAGSWQDLHAALAQRSIELRLQGNGLVLDGGESAGQVKASSIGRAFSKAGLQVRLGPYQTPSLQTRHALQTGRQIAQKRLGRGSSPVPATTTTRAQPNASQAPSSGPVKRYRKRPITRHPGQGKLWRRFLGTQRNRRSHLALAFKTWKDFLTYEAFTDPLALAIVVSQRQILKAINPLRVESKRAGPELSR